MSELMAWAKSIHETAVDKGFWEGPIDVEFVLAKIALCHSELSETLEAVRKQKGPDAIAEELVDTVIRIFDLYYGLWETDMIADSLDAVMIRKTTFNTTRQRLHGNLI